MAMLAVLLCVGNSSCSKEDDLGGNGGVTSGSKKLTEIVRTRDDGVSYDYDIILSYDDNGRLISCNKDGEIYQFSWSDNTITRTKGDDVSTYSYVDGLIRQEQSEDYTLDYAYNSDKQIIARNRFNKHNNTVETKYTYSWINGRITQITEETYGTKYKTRITYGSKTCKGHNPYMTMLMRNTQLFWAHPELIGVTCNQLPTTIKSDHITQNVSYVLDKDGYVVHCSIEAKVEYEGEGYYHEYSDTYTFTWE